VGNSLTAIDCVRLLLGLLDIIPAQRFAVGIPFEHCAPVEGAHLTP
jgi:hypothetical protein